MKAKEIKKNHEKGNRFAIEGNPILMIRSASDAKGKPLVHFVMQYSPMDLFFSPDTDVPAREVK